MPCDNFLPRLKASSHSSHFVEPHVELSVVETVNKGKPQQGLVLGTNTCKKINPHVCLRTFFFILMINLTTYMRFAFSFQIGLIITAGGRLFHVARSATRGQLRCFDLVCGQDFFTRCPGKCQNVDSLVSSAGSSYRCRRSCVMKTTSSALTHWKGPFEKLFGCVQSHVS